MFSKGGCCTFLFVLGINNSSDFLTSSTLPGKVIAFERGDLVFVFNFHPRKTYEGYKVGCDLPDKYRVALASDALVFGGHGRVGHDVDHFTPPEGVPGVPETNFNNRPNSFKVLSPPRTCVAYYRVDEEAERLQRKAASAEKTSLEFMDVEATHVKAPTTKESGESTTSDGGRGSNKDDSGKKGTKYVFRSSDEDYKH